VKLQVKVLVCTQSDKLSSTKRDLASGREGKEEESEEKDDNSSVQSRGQWKPLIKILLLGALPRNVIDGYYRKLFIHF
jgi:hypothetical protein